MTPSAALAEEVSWARNNPDPRSTISIGTLSLWNYPVDHVSLGKEHQEALREFGRTYFMAPSLSDVQFTVRGHASGPGEARNNAQLAATRARIVRNYLQELGFRSVYDSAAGSDEPVDRSPTGAAYARNRRVDVTLYSQPIVASPEATTAPPRIPPSASRSASTTGLEGTFKVTFTEPIDQFTAGYFDIEVHLVGELKAKWIRGPQVGAPAASEGFSYDAATGTFGGEFEVQLRNAVKAQLGFEPPQHGRGGSLKLGVEMEKWGVKPSAGVQLGPRPFFIVFSLEAKFPSIVINDVKFDLEFTGGIQADLGLTPAGWRSVGVAAVAAAETSALVLAVLAVPGTIYLSAEAHEAGKRAAEPWAARDGAASQIASEITGQGALRVKQRGAEWLRNVRSSNAFGLGVDVVTHYLVEQTKGPDATARGARVGDWKQKFASDTAEFDVVRDRVFKALGGLSATSEDLPTAVANL
ncbi:OmpA family protein [Micromonospora sp. DT81.3]|uniref:OmpA family protein n=1 Tax=Micromonospora sp. DT81.3 TaxID=3416523 RepID=UPI003CFB35E6